MKSFTPATAAILAAVALILSGANVAAAPASEPSMSAYSQDPERQKICSGFAEVYNESVKSGREASEEGDIDGVRTDSDLADAAKEGARKAGCEMILTK